MKTTLITILLLISTQWACFAQTDSLKSETPVNSKTYKNNVKIGLLYLLVNSPVFIDVAYQRAISKKSSLSLNAQYFVHGFGFKGAGYQRIGIMPSYNFHLAKFKKDKYNRGVYFKVAAPLEYYANTKFISKGIRLAAAGGVGYQWIIGKRFAIDALWLMGARIIEMEKAQYSPTYISDWHKINSFTTNLYLRPQVMVGYTF